MVPLEYCSENRQRFLLNLNPITNDYTLNGKESVKFGGTFRFVDPNTELYTKVLLKMTLNLGDYHNPQSAKTIQCRTMTIQLAESFEFRPNAELLLLVNSSVNKGEIDSWNAFANKYKIQMMIWNLSLYDGFSYFLQLGDLNFIEMLKQKMVIVLNNPFKLDTAENQRVSNMIPEKKFIEAAKNHQISTMFLSESSQTCLSNFMIPLEKPSPPRIWKKFKDLIKVRKAEWLGLIEKKKIPKKADLNQVQTLPMTDPAFVSENEQMIESPQEAYFESIELFASYFPGSKPKPQDIIQQINKMKKELGELFPDRTFYYFYSFLPKKIGCFKWTLGKVEIREGLNMDFKNEGRFGHAVKSNYRNELYDEFLVIKLLPFSKKLIWLVNNIDDNANVNILIQALTSDLVEEVVVYAKNNWSKLLNCKLLETKMVILNSFVDNDKLKIIMSTPNGRRIYLEVILRYLSALAKLPSFIDYLWCYRTRRILKNFCEFKINFFRQKFFFNEEKMINHQHRDRKKIKTKRNDALNSLINPYLTQVVLQNPTLSVQNPIFLYRQENEPAYPLIKLYKNKFRDENIDNPEAREGAIFDAKCHCYFDLPDSWHDGDPIPITGQLKQFTQSTLIERGDYN